MKRRYLERHPENLTTKEKNLLQYLGETREERTGDLSITCLLLFRTLPVILDFEGLFLHDLTSGVLHMNMSVFQSREY